MVATIPATNVPAPATREQAADAAPWQQEWAGLQELEEAPEEEPEMEAAPVGWAVLLPPAPAVYMVSGGGGEPVGLEMEAVPVAEASVPDGGPPVELAPPEIELDRAGAVAAAPPEAADRGEVIWSAELAVAELDVVDKPEEVRPVAAKPGGERGGEQAGSQARPGRGEDEPAGEPVLEAAPAAPEPVAVPVAGGPGNHGHAPVSDAAQPAGAPPVEAAGGGAVEPGAARALKPGQVAALSVDVPAPAGAEDSAPLRLTVTQRGEQVNVRLRSWDAGMAPLEPERMEPLLQSLAEKGFQAREAGIERAEEAVRESPAPAAEASRGDNGQQASAGAEDRQHKEQERRQAFYLRRQMRAPSTESFDLRSALDGSTYLGATP